MGHTPALLNTKKVKHMEPIYQQEFHVGDGAVDRFGRLKPSSLLTFIQEAACIHGAELGAGDAVLEEKNLFWAILRTRVQITRLPMLYETIRIETWPMPTTRVAYPRSMVAYDSEGRELFRGISLWVLMDRTSRSMVLPGRSGLILSGTVRGNELPAPSSIIPKSLANICPRTVRFTDLDRNGHMNNTRYFDWMADILPSAFHADHPIRELTICYLSEATEGQTLDMAWETGEDNTFRVDATTEDHRVFAAKVLYD